MYVSLLLPPSQDVSRLELTLQTSKQGGIRPREVLLILSVNKSVFLKLQAPGIPLQLAYVSVLPPTTASGTDSGKPLLSTSVGQGPLLLFFILTLLTRALAGEPHGALPERAQRATDPGEKNPKPEMGIKPRRRCVCVRSCSVA